MVFSAAREIIRESKLGAESKLCDCMESCITAAVLVDQKTTSEGAAVLIHETIATTERVRRRCMIEGMVTALGRRPTVDGPSTQLVCNS